MLRTSSSTDSSASVAQIVVEFDGVDACGGGGGKSVEKLSKNRKTSKAKKSQRSSVWRNVYQNTGPPSTKNSSFCLSSDSFSSSFCWARELSQYHIWTNYHEGQANEVADALSHFLL